MRVMVRCSSSGLTRAARWCRKRPARIRRGIGQRGILAVDPVWVHVDFSLVEGSTGYLWGGILSSARAASRRPLSRRR
jgi:hypothetical protein